MVKITTTRETIKDGCKTTTVIEMDQKDPALAEIREYLEVVGFNEPRGVFKRFVRFVSGAR